MRLVALALALGTAGMAGAECRQALALGLDVSGSVDGGEYRLQLDGLAAALDTPEVREVLLGDPGWPVRLAVYEWSGPRQFNRRLLVGWSEITDAAALARVTDTLRGTARRKADPSTALGSALSYGTALLATQTDCPKRTLDLSGDGKNNTGPRPRDVASPDWLTVNGLTVARTDGTQQISLQELTAYYQANVIRGPAAFVEAAEGFDDFQNAMTRKLLREIQGLSLALR